MKTNLSLIKRSFIITSCVLFPVWSCVFTPLLHAQHANVWAFGGKAGLDFNSGSPVAITTSINTWAGCAAVCDAQGQLLFYTDGTVVYNRNGLLMGNGALFGILVSAPTLSPTLGAQATAIASVPGKQNQYYIFSLSHSPSYGPYGLYYSIVDMTLSSGYGNVITGKKLIPLDTGLTSKMTVVKGDDCNIWLVTRSRNVNHWKAYRITDTGINATPVISALGSLPPEEYITGGIRFSPDRQKMVSYNLGTLIGGLELYDFAPQTGVLSNPALFSTMRFNSACFSPDNSKLYALPMPAPAAVHQYDLNLLPNVPATVSSDTIVYKATGSGSYNDIQRGSDGKLYFIGPYPDNPGFVHAISFPNLRGSASQPVINVIPLLSGTTCYIKLPNDNVVLPLPDTLQLARDTVICTENAILQADTTGGRRGHIWNDGTTGSSLTVTTSGVYTVSYRHGCTEYYIDTFRVTFRDFAVTGYAGSSCPGMQQGTAWVEQQDTTLYFYIWTDTASTVLRERQSNHGDTLTGLNPGTYFVQIRDAVSGCDTTISVHVAAIPAPVANFTADTTVCIGYPALFVNLSDAPIWHWDLGDRTTTDTLHPQHLYRHPGTYEVLLAVRNNAGCTDTGRQLIRVQDFTLRLTAGDTLVQKNTEVMLITSAEEPYTVIAWEPAQLFPDQQAYSQRVTADSNMQYMAVAQSAYGCLDSAFIQVYVMGDIFVPSVFSPNGDGRNDFFRPLRTTYGTPVQIRQLQVYNRWGALIWSGSGKMAEQGWDGNHKGMPVEAGVYFWTADFETADGKRITQKGDVTLVR